MVTNFGGESCHTPHLFIALAFHNRLKDCSGDGCFNSSSSLSTSDQNLVSFGPITLKIVTLKFVLEEVNWQNLTYLTNYIRIYVTDFYHSVKLVDIRVGMSNLTFIFQFIKVIAMVTNLILWVTKIAIPHLHSLHWHCRMD